MIAQTLEQAVAIFDPREPLSGATLQAYYVSRDRSPIQRLYEILSKSAAPTTKVVLVGHRGSGKSTELARLEEMAAGDFFVSRFTVEGNLDLAAVDYVQVLFALLKSIYECSRDRGVNVGDTFLEEVREWFWSAMAEVMEERADAVGATAQLDAFFVKLGAKLGSEVTTRQVLRQKLEPRLSDLIAIIDRLCEKVTEKTGMPVLALLDGLDKPDLAVAREIFVQHGLALTAPRCNVVFTVPLVLLFSGDYGVVRQSFSQTFVLPNVTVMNNDDTPNSRGFSVLRALVLRRLNRRLISTAALDELVRSSGGLLRELVQLVQSAALFALTDSSSTITVRAARRACEEVTQNYRRILRPMHFQELIRLRREGPRGVLDELGVDLIENGSLLEYEAAGASWFGVHPLVLPLVQSLATLEA